MRSARDENIRDGGIPRRSFLKRGLGMAGLAGLLATGWIDNVAAARDTMASATGQSSAALLDSIQRGYGFLQTMMDAYDQGTTTRLVQSYSDQNGLFSTAFTYDNALTVLAFLTRGTRDDRMRARVLGDSLLYAQAHDPTYNDGRLRQAYNVGPYVFYDGTPQPDNFVHPDGTVNIASQFGFTGSAVGDMAWAGIALAQLFAATGQQRYEDGATALGNWIVDNAYSTIGFGGYTFGVDGANNRLTYAATEHNIDVYAFFTMLNKLTGDSTWADRAAHAHIFIVAMWNPTAGYFYTGTNPDGTLNPTPIPEDVQTWSYLALLDPTYMASVDWANTNLRVTDTPQDPNSGLTGNLTLSGVSFSSASLRANPGAPIGGYGPLPDPSAVWLEGTAHLADALLQRSAPGDRVRAEGYLLNIRKAQASLGQNQTVGGKPIPTGTGVVAASSPLDTGYGFGYFQYLHIGATSWYLMAVQSDNPYQLGHG
ncbi:MAG: Tat pathway signal sequence domain protein [Herpetosiphonaceae bacterium]|nr:Tat pathway signal sequence domain protein [Herpetosiphonaceae bacterium]